MNDKAVTEDFVQFFKMHLHTRTFNPSRWYPGQSILRIGEVCRILAWTLKSQILVPHCCKGVINISMPYTVEISLYKKHGHYVRFPLGKKNKKSVTLISLHTYKKFPIEILTLIPWISSFFHKWTFNTALWLWADEYIVSDWLKPSSSLLYKNVWPHEVQHISTSISAMSSYRLMSVFSRRQHRDEGPEIPLHLLLYDCFY